MKYFFESAHAIGQPVIVLNNHFGVVVAVRFTESKVTYDVELDMGGETLVNVDSTFVEQAFNIPSGPCEYKGFPCPGCAECEPEPVLGPGGPVFDRGPGSVSPLDSVKSWARPVVSFGPRPPLYSPSVGRCDDPFCVVCARTVAPR